MMLVDISFRRINNTSAWWGTNKSKHKTKYISANILVVCSHLCTNNSWWNGFLSTRMLKWRLYNKVAKKYIQTKIVCVSVHWKLYDFGLKCKSKISQGKRERRILWSWFNVSHTLYVSRDPRNASMPNITIKNAHKHIHIFNEHSPYVFRLIYCI